jgi:hypothetical protein
MSIQVTQEELGCGDKQLLIVGKSGIVQPGFELAIMQIVPTLQLPYWSFMYY